MTIGDPVGSQATTGHPAQRFCWVAAASRACIIKAAIPAAPAVEALTLLAGAGAGPGPGAGAGADALQTHPTLFAMITTESSASPTVLQWLAHVAAASFGT
jgi:hypothetical protein